MINRQAEYIKLTSLKFMVIVVKLRKILQLSIKMYESEIEHAVIQCT